MGELLIIAALFWLFAQIGEFVVQVFVGVFEGIASLFWRR